MAYFSIDLFAGIGGIRLGFEQAFGNSLKTVFACELDKYARATYRRNFQDSFAPAEDITQVGETSIPAFDICLAGFPCQAFSRAGKQQGFDDTYRGRCRGTLFREVVRICEHHKPKIIFCENVKGLRNHDGGRTLNIILESFRETGYDVHTQLLDSADFGTAQSRERIYIVAFRKDLDSSFFSFPEGKDRSACIEDILENNPVSVRYYLSDHYLRSLRKHRERHSAQGHGFGYIVLDPKGKSHALVCGGMGRERNLVKDMRLQDFTPVTNIRGTVNREGIRNMTPREWARLQGFPDTFRLDAVSDTQLYKQLGNSVTIPVISAIAERIRDVLEKNCQGSGV